MANVAVLCVSPRSIYKQLDGVDVYDHHRDARTFRGGMPIVAHPPCRAWSATCRHQAKPPPGERELAPWCVEQLRQWGGILEHPAGSVLWDELALPKPLDRPTDGPFWALQVGQNWWGDGRRKKTWLLFAHIRPGAVDVPFTLHGGGTTRAWDRMSKERRAATPPAMAQWLVDTARHADAPMGAGVLSGRHR